MRFIRRPAQADPKSAAATLSAAEPHSHPRIEEVNQTEKDLHSSTVDHHVVGASPGTKFGQLRGSNLDRRRRRRIKLMKCPPAAIALAGLPDYGAGPTRGLPRACSVDGYQCVLEPRSANSWGEMPPVHPGPLVGIGTCTFHSPPTHWLQGVQWAACATPSAAPLPALARSPRA